MTGEKLRTDARALINRALEEAKPAAAVARALEQLPEAKHYYLLSIGKAGWAMAKAAAEGLGDRLERGLVITKYGHSEGPIPGCEICEAGHPVLDQNSLDATQNALELADGLAADDCLLFLISGGGSALFEHSDLSLTEYQDITKQMLAKGLNIVEMNTLRKRFSNVKGGQFALRVAPAKIYAIVLSDVLGDRLDSIASGPAHPDFTTSEEAHRIVKDYGLELSADALRLLDKSLPQELEHVQTVIVGSVAGLIASAEAEAVARGYETVVLSDCVDCEARELGRLLGTMARTHVRRERRKLAFLLGGETVVTLRGQGLGGRNQETVLAALPYLEGLREAVVFSLGSDGTDGPTDAAGGLADTETAARMRAAGVLPEEALAENDSYHALKAAGALLITGPTGTNVNDLACLLLGD